MELLAPAGDLEILKSAFAAGADAVYFGGDAFGARVNAGFSTEDGLSAIEYAHFHDRKVYLTVNTLLKNVEMERSLYDFLSVYNRAGIDGIIVQDFGVFDFCKKFFPDLPLHASTQMNIASEYGARFMMERGACRIVPARELSIKEIASIHRSLPDLEIEAFLHGALCVCYSGQCLMSSVIGGRSGNRGACAQPCRKKYKVSDGFGNELGEAGYYLSPKDLCGLYALPGLFDAGVTSYKIEGRLKNEAYVAGVVSVYRKYFDMILSGGTADYRVKKADYDRLLSYGNRGGSTDKYFDMRNDVSMVDPSVGAFRQDEKTSPVRDIKLKKKITGELTAVCGEELILRINAGTTVLFANRQPVETAGKRPTTEAEIREKLTQTGEVPFEFERLDIKLSEDAFVPMGQVKSLRREALSLLYDTILENDREIFKGRRENEYEPLKTVSDNDDIEGLFVSVLNEDQLFACAEFDVVKGIFAGEEIIEKAVSVEKEVYLKLPTVIRENDVKRIEVILEKYGEDLAGVMADSYDALGLLKQMGYTKDKIFFGERLYSYSDRTKAAFCNEGYVNQFVPQELNEGELSHRDNSKCTIEIYSQMPVMVMVNCPAKRFYGCKKKPYTRIDLIDERGTVFPVINHCDSCTNYVYNSLPMSLLEDAKKVLSLKPGRLLMNFVFEDASDIKKLLSIYEKNYLEGQNLKIDRPVTRGHFKRGVQ